MPDRVRPYKDKKICTFLTICISNFNHFTTTSLSISKLVHLN